MMKKIFSVILAMTLVTGLLTGCGKKEQPAQSLSGDELQAINNAEAAPDPADKFYIYTWNSQILDRLECVYEQHPDWKDRIEIVNTGDELNYGDDLDQAMFDPEAVTYPDMFVADEVIGNRYFNSDYTLNMEELGITAADISNMYEYALDLARDTRNGSIKGLSWQINPGAFVYRRSLASQYLGVNSPEDMQSYVSDWETLVDTARNIAEKSGNVTLFVPSCDDINDVFLSNKPGPWVDSEKNFVSEEFLKDILDTNYSIAQEKLVNNYEQGSDQWLTACSKDSTFGYFCSVQTLHWILGQLCGGTIKGEGTFGDWAVCEGPQTFYQGAEFLCASAGCSDKDFAKEIFKELCCNTDNLTKYAEDKKDFANNKAVMKGLSSSGKGKYEFLSGQDYITVYSSVAEKIDISGNSQYDSELNALFIEQAAAYRNGEKDRDAAISDFKKAVFEIYPDLAGDIDIIEEVEEENAD